MGTPLRLKAGQNMKDVTFKMVPQGVVTGRVVDDEGEHLLTPGMCAGFKANSGNGHCLKNLTAKPVVYLEVGTRATDETAWYSDIDMKVSLVNRVMTYTKKDGTTF